MTVLQILDTLLLGPLKLVFEVIFQIANRFIGHPGLSIIVLSLIMNVLVLPLYKQADMMQERTRDVEAKLKRGVDHIKKSFSGDERMMILQAYYRQNNYKPISALNGSVSLLLEIPFFMAAYQFLSQLGALSGASLGPIADLSKPDGLLVIGGLTINVLPVIMTAVNVISSAIYLKGYPLKTKIQLYGMAAFFLVFLYTSPSGLVFYWTLNNLFSLVKTIFYKLKHPRQVLNVLLSVLGLGLAGIGIFKGWDSTRKVIFLIGAGVAMQLPLLWMLFGSKLPKRKLADPKPNKSLFITGCVFLTLLVGLLIPSAYLAASPQEYVDIMNFYNPLWYLVSTVCLAAGTFLVWMGVFYWLAGPKGKVLFGRLVWVLSGVMLVNYMFFGRNLGMVNQNLQFLETFRFTAKEQIINLLVLAVVAGVLYFAACKFRKAAALVALTAALAIGGMSVMNIVAVKKSVDEVLVRKDSYTENSVSIPLSKTGQNVVVLMLDRALGYQVPYLFQEKPELAEKFDGFVHYSNTLSFSTSTNLAAPALYGGYEYTPVEMNRRDQELISQKHTEALKVMPALFAENDYKVTVVDPPYAGYQWISDPAVFNEIEGVNAYIAKGTFDGEEKAPAFSPENNKRNFFCFSLMKTLPLVAQPTVYNDGLYNQAEKLREESEPVPATQNQIRHSLSTATGTSADFMKSYNVLINLDEITAITDEDTNTFLCMTNDTTHDPMMLQAPDYVPADTVDNTQYDAEHADRFTLNGRTMITDDDWQFIHYQTNMAVLLRLGDWFDYLREQGVYDNTRIILVSDHGYTLEQFPDLILDDGSDNRLELTCYMPLLMVKDFNSEGFTTSTEFMTNADVPTLAVQDLIENPVNPYTGKPINNDEKTAHPQHVLMSFEYNILVNNGYVFIPDYWGAVEDNVWDVNNWTIVQREMVLKENKLPES